MSQSEHPILAYRRSNQLSLDGLAGLLKVNKSTILRWETGAVPVPVDRLKTISDLTGIAREDLRPDIFRPTPAHMDAAS